jgi:hypothetical protein
MSKRRHGARLAEQAEFFWTLGVGHNQKQVGNSKSRTA